MSEKELSQRAKNVVEKNIQLLEEMTKHIKDMRKLLGKVNYVFLMKDTIDLHLSELEAEVSKKLNILVVTRYRSTKEAEG